MLSSAYLGAHLATAPPAPSAIACEVFTSDLLWNIYLLLEQSCVLPRYTARGVSQRACPLSPGQ